MNKSGVWNCVLLYVLYLCIKTLKKKLARQDYIFKHQPNFISFKTTQKIQCLCFVYWFKNVSLIASWRSDVFTCWNVCHVFSGVKAPVILNCFWSLFWFVDRANSTLTSLKTFLQCWKLKPPSELTLYLLKTASYYSFNLRQAETNKTKLLLCLLLGSNKWKNRVHFLPSCKIRSTWIYICRGTFANRDICDWFNTVQIDEVWLCKSTNGWNPN